MLEVKIDSAALEKELNRLIKKTGDITDLLETIGDDLVESTEQRFITMTEPSGKAWQRNSPVTIAMKGRDRPLTGETLELQRQIHYRVEGDTLTVGSTMEYAATQQYGAKMGEFGRYSQIARVRKYGLGTFKGSAGTKKGFPIPWGDIPARPFIGISDDDRAEIEKTIREFIDL